MKLLHNFIHEIYHKSHIKHPFPNKCPSPSKCPTSYKCPPQINTQPNLNDLFMFSGGGGGGGRTGGGAGTDWAKAAEMWAKHKKMAPGTPRSPAVKQSPRGRVDQSPAGDATPLFDEN